MDFSNLSDEQLLQITRKRYEPHSLWVEIAKELYSEPRFFQSGNQLYFGSIKTGFIPVNSVNVSKYTPYQLMTLREVNPSLYNHVTKLMPHAVFLVNKTRKEYVNFYGQPKEFIPMVREKWPLTDVVKEVVKPYSYRNRFYKNMTEELLEHGLFEHVKLVEEEEEEEKEEEEEENLERLEAQKRVRAEISNRLHARYPEIDKVLNLVKRSKSALFVGANYLLPSIYVEQTSLYYDSKHKLIWIKNRLPDPANPQTNEQFVFLEIISDLVDYMKFM